MPTKRVLSGIRASGRLHLGNYLGAVKGMLQLQNDPQYETLFMVADAHAVTTPYDIDELRQNRREIIIDYLAAGLDPQKSALFYQSDVTEHFELTYYFSAVTTMAKMQHMPTFKEKIKQYPQNVTMALLNYPLLMAADILIYKSELVPVGIDQEPHLEIAREIARRMNQDYGTNFPEPQRFATTGEYVPSLTGEGKMSKSVAGSYIELTDDAATVKRKIRSIPTSSQVGGEMSSGLKALFALADMYLDNEEVSSYRQDYQAGTLRYVEVKDAVAAAISSELEVLQQKRAELVSQPEYIDEVVDSGAKQARAIARKTVQEVKQKMGLN